MSNFEEFDEKLKNSILQANNLARDILIMSRNKLFVNFRFLENAISRLKIETITNEEVLLNIYNESKTKDNNSFHSQTLQTDGRKIKYNYINVLNQYKKEKNVILRDYIHTVLHCIYRHLFVGKLVNQACWDLSCDIAVENIINELNISDLNVSRQKLQFDTINELKTNIKLLTAEKIYKYYLEKDLSNEELSSMRQLFSSDNHSWYIVNNENSGSNLNSNNNSKNDKSKDSENNDNSSNDESEDLSDDTSKNGNNQNGDNKNNDNQNSGDNQNNDNINSSNSENKNNLLGNRETLEDVISDWKDIAENLATDLETFSKNHSNISSSLIQNLREINREKCDYTKFLKKFAVRGEVMKINDDEFDYIFYTYGLKLYDKMPLIEPLEYKDVKRIKEFVIAIDTSGSVQGDLVQKFIEKTYNILKSTESFFSKINIHIIQCDNKIQEDKKITNQEEFDNYIKNMKLRGFGGTDFRPVFSYVDELINNKSFISFKGLIYLTDGMGEYPKKKPNYETAFVFLEDEMYSEYKVPSWAMKVVLREDDIKF